MKPAFCVGIAIIVAALAFGARAFVTNLTPYVPFKQARQARSGVQTIGKLDKKSIRYEQGTLRFTLVDDRGDRLPVEFRGPRAANFEQAMQITAIGQYDGTTFQAKNLLVKCPTKYQGTETKQYGQDVAKNSGGAATPGVEAALKENTETITR